MVLTSLGLAASALFAGAALYNNWAEQPARLALDDQALLKEWKLSYAKGFAMQAPLAVLAALLGLAAFFYERSALAALGGTLMLANVPFTLLFIMPTNKRLEAMGDGNAETRALTVSWARLHAVRTLFGLVGTALFWSALVA